MDTRVALQTFFALARFARRPLVRELQSLDDTKRGDSPRSHFVESSE